MGLLRILLAIAVVITHSGPIFGLKMVGGLNAVQSFYIISGFYMSLILNEKYTGAGTYKLFITNRLLRLYPIYWAVLLICFIASFIAFKVHHGHYAGLLDPYFKYFIKGNMTWGTFFTLMGSNFTLVGQDWLMFTGYHQTEGRLWFAHDFHLWDPRIEKFLLIPQAWTLGVEISFYLIAPFLVRLPLKKLLPILGATILLRIGFHAAGITYDPWSYRFFPLELMYFLLGTVSYHLYCKLKTMEINKGWYQAVFVFMIFATFAYQFIPKNYYYLIKYTYNALIVGAIPFLFILTKDHTFDRWIGELSYPVYICHMLFRSAYSVQLFPEFMSEGITVTAYSILMAILLNKLIADPVERLRQARVKKLANQAKTSEG